jgi:hypothetical protein
MAASEAPVKGRAAKKNYLLLGDDEELWGADKEATEGLHGQLDVQAASGPPPTVLRSTSGDYPADVWSAACRCEDQGAALLSAYQDLMSLRYESLLWCCSSVMLVHLFLFREGEGWGGSVHAISAGLHHSALPSIEAAWTPVALAQSTQWYAQSHRHGLQGVLPGAPCLPGI